MSFKNKLNLHFKEHFESLINIKIMDNVNKFETIETDQDYYNFTDYDY